MFGNQFGTEPGYFEQPPPFKRARLCNPACCCQICCMVSCILGLFAFFTYSYLMATSMVEVHGTTFTFWNYALPQFRFLVAGEWDTTSMTQWYGDLSNGDPTVGIGPGPNTQTLYSYYKVKSFLEGLAFRIKSGTVERTNEFGMQILRDNMWPETGRIMFGLDNGDHATVRPFFGQLFDGGQKPEDKKCDGSTCWNLAWLRSVFQQRLAGLTYFSSGDLQLMIAVLLHKIHLNIDLSDDEARQFVAFQVELMRVIAFPQNVLWETVLGEFPLELKENYIKNYQAAIANKWRDIDWTASPEKAAVLSSAMLDSIALHAGPSVSAALEHTLALLYMQGEPGSSVPRPLAATDEAGMQDLIWEVLRRYPPVAGVPTWVTDDDGQTWVHEIANVQQALQDPSVFPEPLEFRLGRPGLSHANSSLSIGFADFAMVDGDVSHPASHACPGKNLALSIMLAFLQEFSAYQWTVDSANIRLNSYSTSGFTLRKAR